MRSRLSVLVALLFTLSVQASEKEWIEKSIDFTINTRFAEAESLLTGRMARGDSGLAVLFYYASVLNSKMTHFEKPVGETVFLNVLKKVIDRSSRQMEKEKDKKREAQLYFYRGSALGYLAFYQGQSGSWYPAFKNGLKARRDLEKAVERDPSLYDAYLGIGTFQYWVSTRFKWLPLVSDNREEGIANIMKAIAHSTYSRYMAMHQLIYILLDYGKFDEALGYAGKVIEAYPSSPFMWWAYAHTLYKMHRNDQALDAYYKLLGLIERSPQANPMHRVACHVKLAELYARLGDRANCRRHCQTVLNHTFTEDELTEQGEKRLEKAAELLKGCE